MAFQDSADVRTYLGGIFEAAFADEEIAEKLGETGVVLRTVYSDPDAVLVIDTTTRQVREVDGPDAAQAAGVTATMTMSAETGNAYWQGKVNLPLAMAKSRIKVDGNVASLLKLAPLSKKLFPRYVEMLTSDGRDDLIV